jgi:hypothetical protein
METLIIGIIVVVFAVGVYLLVQKTEETREKMMKELEALEDTFGFDEESVADAQSEPEPQPEEKAPAEPKTEQSEAAAPKKKKNNNYRRRGRPAKPKE